jgi:hypothetical protein
MNPISLGGAGRTQGHAPATATSDRQSRHDPQTVRTPSPAPRVAGDLSGQIERIDRSLCQTGRCAEEAGQAVARLRAKLVGLRDQQAAARAVRGHDKEQRDFLRLQIGLCEQQLDEAERDIVVARASVEALEAQRRACVAALDQAQAQAQARAQAQVRAQAGWGESASTLCPVPPPDAGGAPATRPLRALRAARPRTEVPNERVPREATAGADKGKDRMDAVAPTPVMPVDVPRNDARFMAATALGALALGLIGVCVDRSIGLKIGDPDGIAPTFAHLGAMGSLSAQVARGERLDTPLRVTVLALMVTLTGLLIAQGLQSAADAAGTGQSRPRSL